MHVGKDVKTLEPQTLLTRMYKGAAALESSLIAPQEVKHRITM